MKTLTIIDLPKTEELDSRAMSAVRGGSGLSYGYVFPSFDISKFSASFNVQQLAQQSQNTQVDNGNNVAFANGITADTDPVQKAKNTSNINLGSFGLPSA
ncbi:hypothetical protein AWB79_04072 [Caballeronia hypogeia]|uniref:Uncharacterized protein n=1 Tax=Caballeronia hypogeia TaxID=1777140 RepID=A0A158BQA5_9BURK|nr:hypothetical protein [Caballeronia hypogeia]SAK72265.1 hypothetical protein AWB79_04072 [Caballeronia hypogeia]